MRRGELVTDGHLGQRGAVDALDGEAGATGVGGVRQRGGDEAGEVSAEDGRNVAVEMDLA